MREKSHISVLIFMMALSLFSSYHIYYYFLDKGSDNLVRKYYENKEANESQKVVQKMSTNEKEDYFGILKIPKINIVQGFYNIESKNNNVGKSVTLLKESTIPNINGGVIYLTAHSGYGYLAYFKDLDKLKINDLIYLDISNNTYQYIVSDIYELDKTGNIEINHNTHENILVLSTCSNSKDKQLVVVSKLINK